MSLYQQFKTDENYERNGIWLEYGSKTGKPVRIKIARAGGTNIKFLKALELKARPYRRQLQNDTIDPEVAEELFRQVYVESVILGWENVDTEDGKPLEFNRFNCLKLLTDLPDLFADIREQATKASLFRSEVIETASKNS